MPAQYYPAKIKLYGVNIEQRVKDEAEDNSLQLSFSCRRWGVFYHRTPNGTRQLSTSVDGGTAALVNVTMIDGFEFGGGNYIAIVSFGMATYCNRFSSSYL